MSHAGVFVQLGTIGAAAVSAIVALARRERPALLAVLGLVSSAVLIGEFWYSEFYAVGFDRDTWAPR